VQPRTPLHRLFRSQPATPTYACCPPVPAFLRRKLSVFLPFAFETAVIIQDGIRRMYKDGENVFYYITVMNEPYAMPPMPGNVKGGILQGMYRFRPAAKTKAKLCARLFGSSAILTEALRAQLISETKSGVGAEA